MSGFQHEPEWKTRIERIDKSLAKHWTIIKHTPFLDCSTLTNHAVTEFPTATGPADYVFFVDGKPVAALEAKRVSTAAQEVLGQAKRYSRSFMDGIGNWGGYKIPLLYSSNGETTWFLDVRSEKNIRRKTKGIHTPTAMLEMLEHNLSNAVKRLMNNPVASNMRLRPYQVKAIEETEKALLDNKREMLIAMATGTGKTFLTVSQLFRLLESRMFKRILELVLNKFQNMPKKVKKQILEVYNELSNRFNRQTMGVN